MQGVSECGDDGFSEQNCEGREQKGAGRVQGNPLRDPLRQQNNSGGDQMASWEILKIEVSMEKNRKQLHKWGDYSDATVSSIIKV